MLVTSYVRDGVQASKSAKLRCDKCGAESRPMAVDTCKEVDDWDRLALPTDGWSRYLQGRMLRDACPACSH